MKSTPVVDHMKKEMGEDFIMGRKKDAKLARVCAEFLLEKLKPVLSMLSPDISKHKSEYDQMISGLCVLIQWSMLLIPLCMIFPSTLSTLSVAGFLV